MCATRHDGKADTNLQSSYQSTQAWGAGHTGYNNLETVDSISQEDNHLTIHVVAVEARIKCLNRQKFVYVVAFF